MIGWKKNKEKYIDVDLNIGIKNGMAFFIMFMWMMISLPRR